MVNFKQTKHNGCFVRMFVLHSAHCVAVACLLFNDVYNNKELFSLLYFGKKRSLKTFRLKKKSSTLGINRTSESPPTLRHVDESYGSRTTINGQARHTVDVGLASNFQRGVAYRSSLQELNSNVSNRIGHFL